MRCSIVPLAAVCVLTAFSSGCVDRNARKETSESVAKVAASAHDAPEGENLGEEKPREVKNFFKKGSRLTGALSDEGAEIERSLGVY